MDALSYQSFLIRLWRAQQDGGSGWSGEVEHIQSGTTVTVRTLEEALDVVRAGITQEQGAGVLPEGMGERP